MILAVWLPHGLLVAEPRFHFPLTPLLAVFAGPVLAGGAVQRIRRRTPRGLACTAAAGCALAAIWIADIVTSFPEFAGL